MLQCLTTVPLLSLLLAITSPVAVAQDAPANVASYETLVPRHLLSLLHAPEVHTELTLSADQITRLEELFTEIDAVWFPARILPADQQFTTIRELERRVLDWFRKHASPAQYQRLRQLEHHAQGPRTLLRDDVGKRIGLEGAQQAKLAELAEATNALQLKLARAKYGDPEIETLQQQLVEAIRAERTEVTQNLTLEQKLKLGDLIGTAFDPSRLKRIYAKAPEFQSVEHWINSAPLTLQELRGKVVLVHFYAFQCHNCHANFGIYQRWHRELTDRGVVVIGIQTPETKRERDPNAVKAAAAERELEFPILIDLDSKNWNAWGNTMWPTIYVIDTNGYIRHWWQGELNWKGATGDETIEKLIDELLAEANLTPIPPPNWLNLKPPSTVAPAASSVLPVATRLNRAKW